MLLAAAQAQVQVQVQVKVQDELCRKAAKRMANQGLSKGWGAWFEMYEETERQRRMLAAAVS